MPSDVMMNGGRQCPASEPLTAKLARLPDLDTPTLRREWQRLYRSHPPARITRDLLVLAIAWKLQERVYGGLRDAQKRKLVGMAEDLRMNGGMSARPATRLKPGLTLLREWHGTTHRVLVLEEGYEWNGERRQSLSAIAREITGAKWSGPRFFNVQYQPKPMSGKGQSDA